MHKAWTWLHCALSLAAQCIVIGPVCGHVCNGLAGAGVCYHDNSKLRASIFTKLGLYVQVVTISILAVLRPRKGVCGGAKFFGSAWLQPARSVCVSLSAFSCWNCSEGRTSYRTSRASVIKMRFSLSLGSLPMQWALPASTGPILRIELPPAAICFTRLPLAAYIFLSSSTRAATTHRLQSISRLIK